MVSLSRHLLLLLLPALAVIARAGQVTLPAGNTATSMMTVHVSAQCRLAVPGAIAFSVNDTTVDTHSTPVAVAVRGIVLSQPTERIKVSIQAVAGQFTPPTVGAPTWSAADISWAAAAWVNGAGHPGVLSATAFTEVASSTPGAVAVSTDSLVFTLKANPAVVAAGDHTLQLVWKIESVTP